MKNRMLRVLLLSISICYGASVQAQITIGSEESPGKGALLDLKQVGTTTRGLLLPRVGLEKVDQLKPMYSYKGTDKPSTADEKKHAGLVVYNVGKQPRGECDFTPNLLKIGLYCWDGEEWKNIGEEDPTPDDMIKIIINNSEVRIFIDERPHSKEPYTCRRFGDKIWMTMNLRAKEYSDGTPIKSGPTFTWDPNANPLPPASDRDKAHPRSGKWYMAPYPTEMTLEDGTTHKFSGYDDTWLKDNILAGLIYNYAAVVNGATNLSKLNNHQGICPTGWHVPQKDDYDKLVDHIFKDEDTKKEFLVPLADGTYPTTKSKKNALVVPCAVFDLVPGAPSALIGACKGRSKSYSDGGFGDFALGMNAISGGLKPGIMPNFSKGNHSYWYVNPTITSFGDYETNVSRIGINGNDHSETDKKPSADMNYLLGYGIRCVKDNNVFDF